MAKKENAILKIVGSIALLSLALLVLYAFYSSEKGDDSSQNDPSEDNIQKDKPPESHTANHKAFFPSKWKHGKGTLLGSYLGLGVFLWCYGQLLQNKSKHTAALWRYKFFVVAVSIVIGALVGYWLDTKYLERFAAKNTPYYMGIMNTLLAFTPTLIRTGIAYLVDHRVSNCNDTNAPQRLQEIRKLMKVGTRVGIIIGLLTFTVASYLKCYEGVDTAASIGQFLPKLKLALSPGEWIALGVLSVIPALVSSKASKYDFKSWETAAILGAIIVTALLIMQLVHTVATKPPGKCTLLCVLAWALGYALLVLKGNSLATWWDRKNIGSAVAMYFIGYLGDVYAKSWVDGLGDEIKGAKMNVVNSINVGLVVIDTILILWVNKGKLTLMHGIIAAAVIAIALYIGWYTYDGIAKSIGTFSKEHGKQGWGTLVGSILFCSAAVALATLYISFYNKWNNNQSTNQNQVLVNTPHMSLICQEEHILAILLSFGCYVAIGKITKYYDPISPKSSLLFLPGFMLSELAMWLLYYRKKYRGNSSAL